MPAPLLAFRRPEAWVPPAGASPLLASILLAIELCAEPAQLAAWWDWPRHRAARWHLSAEEQQQAAEALQRRRVALQHAA